MAGGDDLARMEKARDELIQQRDIVAAKLSLFPEQKKRKIAALDADIKLISQAIIAQKEFVQLDPDRVKMYQAEKSAIAEEKRLAELDKAASKHDPDRPKPPGSGTPNPGGGPAAGLGDGQWLGGGSPGDGDISGR